MNKTILFVSHEASRTGAPIVLLHFLKWFKANTNIQFIILLKWPGELITEFEELAPTYIYQFEYQPLIGLKGKILANWNTYIGIPLHYKRLKKQLLQQNIGLIYLNGIGNGVILDFLSFLQCKAICHVHELYLGIIMNGKNNLEFITKHTIHYIAASNAVKTNLVDNHQINEKNTDVVYEFIEIDQSNNPSQGALLNRFDIPEGAFIVGAAGTMDLRKGFDLFVQLAREVSLNGIEQDIYFVWIGGNLDGDIHYIIKRDLEKLKLEKKVLFAGSQPNPLDYFSDFDVFVMLSREDPYPLVCLESASLGKPIICFEDSGGMPEFVADDAGFVVPYLDINEMANKITILSKDQELKKRLGENARKKALQYNDVNVAAPKILSLIKKFF